MFRCKNVAIWESRCRNSRNDTANLYPGIEFTFRDKYVVMREMPTVGAVSPEPSVAQGYFKHGYLTTSTTRLG